MEWVWALLLLPVLTGLITWQIRKERVSEKVQATGALGMLVVGLVLAIHVWVNGTIQSGVFYVDAFSAFNLTLIVVVGFIASLYSIGYIRHEWELGEISEWQFRTYYLWFHLFLATMLVISVLNNVGLVWAGIELTTLVSALLVAFYRTKSSLEAAWKYLMMGSLGIAFAFIGVMLLYLSGAGVLGAGMQALDWSALRPVAGQLNETWMLFAFIFILIGFGTKAGIAPMHFWLPDAHSQAPSPISAVLSGVLLNTALYAILRVFTITNVTLHGEASTLLLLFGLLSIGITIPFMLIQRDLKRLLAYSSVEHIGIITLGVGIGGALGMYGAVLHMFNHAMTKSLLFFTAGNIKRRYHSQEMEKITGVLKALPITGTIFLIAIFAIAGAPPFGLFISEFTIMRAGFVTGHIGVTVAFILLVALIFAGMVYQAIRISFGEVPDHLDKIKLDRWSKLVMFLPLIAVIGLGLYVPSVFSSTIQQVAHVLQGVSS